MIIKKEKAVTIYAHSVTNVLFQLTNVIELSESMTNTLA